MATSGRKSVEKAGERQQSTFRILWQSELPLVTGDGFTRLFLKLISWFAVDYPLIKVCIDRLINKETLIKKVSFMTKIAYLFAQLAKQNVSAFAPMESYLGVLLYAYRRKHGINRKDLADQWNLDEERIFRFECGFISEEDIDLLVEKLYL